MKKLLALALFFAASYAHPATVMVNGLQCQEPCTAVITYGGAAPVPVPVPVPVPTPTPTPPPMPLPASCDTSKTLFQISSHTIPINAGSQKAFSFTAAAQGQLSSTYQTVDTFFAVSQNPCDFTSMPFNCTASGLVQPVIYYSNNDARMCVLTEGRTYYLNVRTARKDDFGNLVETCQPGATCFFFPAIF